MVIDWVGELKVPETLEYFIEGDGPGLVTQSSYERKRPRRVSLNTHNPPREARTAAVSRYADRHTDTHINRAGPAS